MKSLLRLFAVIAIFLIGKSADAQKEIYLDEKWEKCKKSVAAYKAIVTKVEGGLNHIDVFHYPANNPWTTGNYTSKIPQLKSAEGLITWYHPDGSIMQKTTYVNGKEEGDDWSYWPDGSVQIHRFYKHGIEEGCWYWLTEKGDTTLIKNYSSGKLHGELIRMNPGHVLVEKSNYFDGKLHGDYAAYFGKDSLDMQGQYDMGSMQGTWKYYHKNGQLASKEEYSSGNIQSAEIFNENGKKEELKITLEQLIAAPAYQGGPENLNKVLLANVVYPEEAKENNIQGKVYVSIKLDPSGVVQKTWLTRKKIGYGLDEEALKAARELTDWQVYYNHNRKYLYTITVPINFSLK